MIRTPNCTCNICGKAIYRRPFQIESRPVYCSQACAGKAQRKPRVCPVCGKEFLADRSEQKTCSHACANVNRTGMRYRLSSRPKKDKADDSRTLKKRLIEERGPRCERCGYSNVDILVVHHIIRRSDGGTNDPENLQVVCPNCHAEIHFYGVKQNLKGCRDKLT